jgi:hypothetical protein
MPTTLSSTNMELRMPEGREGGNALVAVDTAGAKLAISAAGGYRDTAGEIGSVLRFANTGEAAAEFGEHLPTRGAATAKDHPHSEQ